MSIWKKNANILTLKSKWVDIYCDSYSVDKETIEYWTVQRPSSLIILTIHNEDFILLKNNFRPGINELAIDFPGGRLENNNLFENAKKILQRELSLEENDYILSLLSDTGFPSDSSFSSQKVYYGIAKIKMDVILEEETFMRYNISSEREELFKKLTCLQCRCGAFEYIMQHTKG